MNKTLHKALYLSAFVTGVGFASHANADLILSGSLERNNITTNFCAKDQFANGSCPDGTSFFFSDFDAAVGTFQTNFFFSLTNTFIFVTSANLFQPTPSLALTFSNLDNDTNDPITLHLSISQTNFSQPISQTTQTGSGTFQLGTLANLVPSTATLTWYLDPLNSQGGEALLDRPGNLLDSFSTSAQTTSSFSHSDLDPVAVTNPFSMTLGLDLTIVPGVSVTNFSQRITGILAPTNGTVPEPGSFALSLLGLAGLGAICRLRRTH